MTARTADRLVVAWIVAVLLFTVVVKAAQFMDAIWLEHLVTPVGLLSHRP